jgi:hypothetical protein
MRKIINCSIRPQKCFPYRQIEFEGEAIPRKGDLIVNHHRLLTPYKTFSEDGRCKSQTNYVQVLRRYAENEILAIGRENSFLVAARLVTNQCWLYTGRSGKDDYKDYTPVEIPPRFFLMAKEEPEFNPLELRE